LFLDVLIDGTMSEESQNEASTNPATLAVEAAATAVDGSPHDRSTNVSHTQIAQV
jgi:hypothetical protein